MYLRSNKSKKKFKSAKKIKRRKITIESNNKEIILTKKIRKKFKNKKKKLSIIKK